MSRDLSASPLVRLQNKYRIRYDATALLVYTLFVYGWSFSIGALGRDFPLLAGAETGLDGVTGAWLSAEVALFGSTLWPYHAVNAGLLYACTLCVYGLGRQAIPEGPIWFATLAAAIFMANPVHSSATLNLAGAVDLLPALAALLALFLHGLHGQRPKVWTYPAALAAFSVAVILFERNSMLIAVVALMEAVVLRRASRASHRRLMPFAAAAIAAWVFHLWPLTGEELNLARSIGPVYFAFYPIGLLPETARVFQSHSLPGTAAVIGPQPSSTACLAPSPYAFVRGMISWIPFTWPAEARSWYPRRCIPLRCQRSSGP